MRCCFLLLLSRLAIGQIVPYGHNPAAGHYATLRGIRLYYETYGAGPPLLLLHGNGGRSQEFSQNIPYFAKRYRVLALDSRDHGQSVDACNSLSFEMMVRRLCGPAHAPAPRLGLRARLERRRHHGAGAGPAPPGEGETAGRHRRQPVARFHGANAGAMVANAARLPRRARTKC